MLGKLGSSITSRDLGGGGVKSHCFQAVKVMQSEV